MILQYEAPAYGNQRGIAIFLIAVTLFMPAIYAFSTPTQTSRPASASSKERSDIAKNTWQTVALATPPSDRKIEIDLATAKNMQVFNDLLFDDFKKMIGTYFINGLSSCRVGNRLLHPFEAHGFLKAIELDGEGGLTMKTAIVETRLTMMERLVGFPIARGVMSKLSNPVVNALSSSDRDTANLSAVLWPPPGKSSAQTPVLIVAGDNGSPHYMDPTTLRTLGKLSDLIPQLKGKKFLAHMRIDDSKQRLILCSTSIEIKDKSVDGGGSTILEFLEFDTDLTLVSSQQYKTSFMVFHDWMITENYYVVPKNPAVFKWENLPQFLLGTIRGVEIFDMDYSKPGELLLIPRHQDNDEESSTIVCTADSFFNIFHFGPCYEDAVDKTKLTVYGSVFDKYKFGGEMGFDAEMQEFDPIRWSSSPGAPAPNLDEFVVNLETGSIVSRTRKSLVDGTSGEDIPVDMPTFLGDGKECQFSYFVGAARPEGWFPFRSIVKADLKNSKTLNWDAGDDSIVSEPMFLPRRNAKSEDDGFLMSIVHCTTNETCELAVWDAIHFDQGPIAMIGLGELMPWCVHGTWVDGFVSCST